METRLPIELIAVETKKFIDSLVVNGLLVAPEFTSEQEEAEWWDSLDPEGQWIDSLLEGPDVDFQVELAHHAAHQQDSASG